MLASYTAYSRVEAEKHHLDDVLGGMGVALVTNWLAVTPIDERFVLAPIAGDDRLGLQLQLKDKGVSAARIYDPSRPRQWRFDFQIGGVWFRKNDVRVPNSADTIDWRWDEESNPTSSVRVGIEYAHRNRHEGWIGLMPVEVRDFGRVSEDTDYAGTVIPADLELRTLYLLHDWRFRYRYNFFPESKLDFKLGGGIGVLDSEVSLKANEDEDLPPGGGAIDDDFFEDGVGDNDVAVIPLAHLHLGVRFNKRFALYYEGDYGATSLDRYMDNSVIFRLYFGKRWDMEFGYRRIDRLLEKDEFYNDMHQDRTVIGVGYRL